MDKDANKLVLDLLLALKQCRSKKNSTTDQETSPPGNEINSDNSSQSSASSSSENEIENEENNLSISNENSTPVPDSRDRNSDRYSEEMNFFSPMSEPSNFISDISVDGMSTLRNLYPSMEKLFHTKLDQILNVTDENSKKLNKVLDEMEKKKNPPKKKQYKNKDKSSNIFSSDHQHNAKTNNQQEYRSSRWISPLNTLYFDKKDKEKMIKLKKNFLSTKRKRKYCDQGK